MTAPDQPRTVSAAPLPAWLPAPDAMPAGRGLGAEERAAAIAAAIGQRFADAMPEGVRVTVSRLSALPAEAALRHWSGRSLAAQVTDAEGRLLAVIAVDIATALGLADLSAGGEGRESDLPARRNLTRIEQELLRPHLALIAEALAEAVAGGGATDIGPIEAKTESMRLPDMRAKAISIRFALHGAGRGGAFETLIPAERFAGGGARAGAAATAPAGMAPFADAAIRLHALLEDDSLELRALAALAIGEVLPLGLSAASPVRLFAGERPIATGALGAVGARLGVRISRIEPAAAGAR